MRQEEQQTALAEAQTGASAATRSGSSVMSGNFAQREPSASKYVQATLDSVKQDSRLGAVQNQNAFALILEAQSYISDSNGDGELSSAELYLAGRKSERMMLRKQREKEQEASEKALDEIKDEREKAVEEAIVPKDSRGEPILIGPGAVNETSAAPDAEVAQVESAPASAGCTGINTAPMPEQTRHAAQAQLGAVTIDIRV